VHCHHLCLLPCHEQATAAAARLCSCMAFVAGIAEIDLTKATADMEVGRAEVEAKLVVEGMLVPVLKLEVVGEVGRS
jgi:hypothetical protein